MHMSYSDEHIDEDNAINDEKAIVLLRYVLRRAYSDKHIQNYIERHLCERIHVENDNILLRYVLNKIQTNTCKTI
jgi:hypothetical protein